ncbi:hypothetical protein QZH41_016893, partial [Actinostola sp. cb2023]
IIHPFGWNDVDSIKTLKSIVVNSYNASAISDEYITGQALEDLSAQFDQFPTLPKASPKTGKQSSHAKSTATWPPETSIDKQIQLETLKNSNLQLQLEVTRAQLELTKLNNISPSSPSPAQPDEIPSMDHILASTPYSALHDEGRIEIPTLGKLRQADKKRKAPSLLPNDFIFSAKGKIEYEKLEIAEFVGGFLEFLKIQPEAAKQRYVEYLQLLMERATVYTWTSVRNFHISVHNAVDSGRLSYTKFDIIRDRSQTFFTHAELRSMRVSSTYESTLQSNQQNRKDLSRAYRQIPVDPGDYHLLGFQVNAICSGCRANHYKARERHQAETTSDDIEPEVSDRYM